MRRRATALAESYHAKPRDETAEKGTSSLREAMGPLGSTISEVEPNAAAVGRSPLGESRTNTLVPSLKKGRNQEKSAREDRRT